MDEKDHRSLERLKPPEGFPSGPLGAGELASLLEWCAGDSDYMKGFLYGLQPESKVAVATLAARYGVRPSDMAWVQNIASGHVGRVVMRLPAEIAAEFNRVLALHSVTVSGALSTLASLDHAVEDACVASSKARASAEEASRVVGELSDMSDLEPGKGLAEVAAKAARVAAAEAVSSVVGSVGEVAASVMQASEDARLRREEGLRQAAHAAGEEMSVRLSVLSKGLLARAREGAKAAAVEAVRKGRVADPWRLAKIWACASAFFMCVCLCAALGFSAGKSEAMAAAYQAQEVRR